MTRITQKFIDADMDNPLYEREIPEIESLKLAYMSRQIQLLEKIVILLQEQMDIDLEERV